MEFTFIRRVDLYHVCEATILHRDGVFFPSWPKKPSKEVSVFAGTVPFKVSKMMGRGQSSCYVMASVSRQISLLELMVRSTVSLFML